MFKSSRGKAWVCRKTAGFMLVFSLLFAFAVAANATAVPEIAGSAYVLMDGGSGQVLAEKNSDAKLFPASTTKIMTMVLALEAVARGEASLEDQVTTSENAASMGGSQVYLYTGEKRSLKEMLIGIAVGSGNDAAMAVAEFIGGSPEGFAELMNKRAAELGMTGTHYMNPHGLHHENHYTTAMDMAKLGYHAVSVPHLLEFTSIYEYDFRPEPKPLKLWNTNRLLKWYEGADGLKTGYTAIAHRNLVATAKRNDLRLITVVMGVEPANGHFTESMKLLNYGFNGFEYKLLYPAGEAVCSVPVIKGNLPSVEAKLVKPVGSLTAKGSKDEYTTNLKVDPNVTAPIAAGGKLGEMQLLKNGKVIGVVDLVAVDAVGKITLKQGWENILQDIAILD